MTLTWKQHNRWMNSEFQHLVWFKKREIKMVLGRQLSFWNLVPDHPLSFQTQACLVFVARKDENRKDVRQLHQSARIPRPPPTSALELIIRMVLQRRRLKAQVPISSWSLYPWWWISCYPSTPFWPFVGFASIKTTTRSPREVVVLPGRCQSPHEIVTTRFCQQPL